MDFCSKSSGFADFKNTVDRGSAVNADCICPNVPKRNLDHSYSALVGIYQFTLTLLFPDVFVVSDLNQNVGGLTIVSGGDPPLTMV